METAACSICLKPKAPHKCGVCATELCKKCARFLDEDEFSFFKRIPENLTKGIYCNPCYTAKVDPLILRYNEIMERAREVYVFGDDQGKESKPFSRLEPAVEVEECADRNETLLRLAFLAAQGGFNGLVDVSLVSEKVRDHAFQTSKWRGSGIPTQIDPKKLNRNKAFL